MHEWEQRLNVHEQSERYGNAVLHVRPFSLLGRLAAGAGLTVRELRAFSGNSWWADPPDDKADLTSYRTRDTTWRGGFAQPWCHAILEKP